MDRIRQLETFVQVTESGNFTRAAAALGVPRSTVSTVIQALEDRLGTQLLRRSTRSMVLTDDGQRFLKRARELIDAMGVVEHMFRSPAERLSGRLRVDMPGRIGCRYIVPALPDFLGHHPELQVEVNSSDRRIELLSEGVDCVIRFGVLEDADIICRKLGDVDVVTCASPAYLEAHGLPRDLPDLAHHQVVHYASGQSVQAPGISCRRGDRDINHPVRARVTVNNIDTYIAAARAGLGLIQVPRFDVADLLEQGVLVRVLDRLDVPPLQVSLLHARRRNLPVRISAFEAWVTRLLSERGVFAA